MHKMVYQIFKTLMLSMIFVMVFDITSYLYRAMSLNTKMENLMTSLQRTVSDNNGLPSETAETYAELLKSMAINFNTNGAKDPFVVGMSWNYKGSGKFEKLGNTPDSITSKRYYYDNSSKNYVSKDNVNILHTDMADIGDYGDIHACQVRVAVAQPMWGWGNLDRATYTYSSQSAMDNTGTSNWKKQRESVPISIFYYTYYVPDIRYKSVTQ